MGVRMPALGLGVLENDRVRHTEYRGRSSGDWEEECEMVEGRRCRTEGFMVVVVVRALRGFSSVVSWRRE